MTAPIGTSRLDAVHPDMIRAQGRQIQAGNQIQQLQQQVAVLLDRSETYGRALILIIKAIETGTEGALMRVDGKIAVRLEAMKEVPEKWRISAKVGTIETKDDPTLKPENVVVFEITEKPVPPTLIVPNGVVK